MRTKVYKLYANTATSSNAAASIIVQRDGYIHAIAGNMAADNTADGSSFLAELSTQSVSQATTNDTLGVLFALREYHNSGAAGTFLSGKSSSVSGLAIPVKAGDRLYLNTSQTAVNLYTEFFVYVAE